jgi:hypothetical protein
VSHILEELGGGGCLPLLFLPGSRSLGHLGRGKGKRWWRQAMATRASEVKESPAFFFEFWLMFIGSNYKKISFPLAKKIWAVQATHTRL